MKILISIGIIDLLLAIDMICELEERVEKSSAYATSQANQKREGK